MRPRVPRSPRPLRAACGAAVLRATALAAALAACGPAPDDEPPRDPGAAAATADATPPPPPLAIPADAPTVAFLGDSLAAGLHLARHEAFPAVLQRRLAAAGRPFRLVNAGVSGDTTAGGRERVGWLLAQRPDVVVVELGANDGLRGQPVEGIAANLRAIVADVRAAGAHPLLLGMRLPPNYGDAYTAAFDALYPALAEELGVAFVPFFMEGVAGVPDLTLPDGLHPTVAGHERLAANIEPALRKELDALQR